MVSTSNFDSELHLNNELCTYLDNIARFDGSIEDFVNENGLYSYHN